MTDEEDVTGIQWIEARDAANFLQCTKSTLTIENYLPPKVNNAKIEKPWFIGPWLRGSNWAILKW